MIITVYCAVKRIICLKTIVFFFSIGVILLILQFAYNLYLVSDYGPFDSISVKNTFMLKLGADDRLIGSSYTAFISVIACVLVKAGSILLGNDIGSECDDNDDEEVKEDASS